MNFFCLFFLTSFLSFFFGDFHLHEVQHLFAKNSVKCRIERLDVCEPQKNNMQYSGCCKDKSEILMTCILILEMNLAIQGFRLLMRLSLPSEETASFMDVFMFLSFTTGLSPLYRLHNLI